MSMSSLGGLSLSTSRCPCIAGRETARCGAVRCVALRQAHLADPHWLGRVSRPASAAALRRLSSAACYPSSGGSRLGEAAEASSGELELVASAAAAAAADFSASLAQ
jgi:hypothetical protein